MATTNQNTVTQTFPVLGMTCASCASSAESIVTHQEGVVSASVNYATGNLIVEFLSIPQVLYKSTHQIQIQIVSSGVGTQPSIGLCHDQPPHFLAFPFPLIYHPLLLVS